MGGTAVSVGSTAQHDMKVLAVVLAALLALGVLTANPQRTNDLIQGGQDWLARQRLMERAWRFLT